MEPPAKGRDLSRNQAAVLAILTDAGEPLTAYQILSRTAPAGLTAPTQVYRALKSLCDSGLVHRLESMNAFMACHDAPHTDDVALLLCQACGRVEELELEATMGALKRNASQRGFHIDRALVEVLGRCAACQQSDRSPLSEPADTHQA